MTETHALPTSVPPLFEALKQIPDFRRKRGIRYRLESVLALAIAATLCGYDPYGAMAEWGKNYGVELAAQLGFKNGTTPSVGTLHTVFAKVDKAALQTALTQWTEHVLLALDQGKSHGNGSDQKRFVAVTVDSKTLRGTRTQ